MATSARLAARSIFQILLFIGFVGRLRVNHESSSSLFCSIAEIYSDRCLLTKLHRSTPLARYQFRNSPDILTATRIFIGDLMSDAMFDAETGKVAAMGVEVIISAKEAVLLGLLMESAGQIHGKDELANLVWPERAGWNDSSNLTQLISKLRRSLRPTGLDKSIVTCGRQGYKFARACSTTPVKISRRGARIAILLTMMSSATLSYFLGETICGHRVFDVVEKNITVNGVAVTLHIVNSPSLQSDWIEHTLESRLDPSTTDVFAARRGEVVYMSILDKHGGRTRVVDLGSEL
jgi:DNA-binding winged helix-turn-helix (wHTH) protein